MIEVFVIGSEG